MKNINFNIFKNKHEANPPIEEIKSSSESNESLENSQEQEVSQERIEALKGLEGQLSEFSSLKEDDLKRALENPETSKELSDKINTFQKYVDILKDYGIPLLTGVLTAFGIALLTKMNVTAEMWDSGAYQVEKTQFFLVELPTVVAGFISILTSVNTYSSSKKGKIEDAVSA